MYRELSQLVLYSDLGEDAILTRLAEIFRELDRGGYDQDLSLIHI